MKNITYYLCIFSLFILFISCNKDFEVFSPNGTAEETTIYLNEDSEVVDLESLSLFTSRDEVVSNLEQIKSDQIIFVYAGDTLGIANGLRNITFTGNSGSLKSKNDPVTFYSESIIINILEKELFISSFDKQFPNDMAVKFANNADAYKVESEDMQASVEKGTYKGSSYLIYNHNSGASKTKLSSDKKIIVRNTDYKALERYNKSIGETGFNCTVGEHTDKVNSTEKASQNNNNSSLVPYSRLVQGQFEVVIYEDLASLPDSNLLWSYIAIMQYSVASATEGKVQVTPRIYPVIFEQTLYCVGLTGADFERCWIREGLRNAVNIAQEENIDWYYNFSKASHAGVRGDCVPCKAAGLANLNGYYSITQITVRNPLTFAHEIGHNLGAIHVPSGSPPDVMSGGSNAHNYVENISRIRRYITSRLYSATYINNVNLALNKPINVSSSANNTSPSAANDGNTNGNQHQGSVFNTAGGPNEFWEVNLENQYKLKEIIVYNRTDCCSDRLSGAKVYASATPFTESNTGKLLYELDGSDVQLITLYGNASYQYIRITSNGTNDLLLAEVEIYEDEEQLTTDNVALGKPTYASSSHVHANPSNATNGNTNGQFPNGAHTMQGAYQFWEVNLQNHYNLQEIRVYNRTDCCMDRLNGAKVYASSSSFSEYNTGTLLYELDGSVFQLIDIDSNAPYKYIRIVNNGNDNLSLAEVEVYGVETEGPQNVALGKPTNVSSSANNTSPSSATDGNTDGNQHNGSVFNSGNGPNEFWEVSLENYYNLEEIKIYNRTDCCSDRLNGAKVYASATPFTESNLGTFLYELDASPIQSIAINSDAPYKYIRIVNNGNNRIVLAEVEVYGIETEGSEIVEPPIENVALGKPTKASSSHIHASPSNATNGNTNGQFPNGAHTLGNGPNEFWEVNLVNHYNLEEIKVYNRTDCCMDRLNGAKVYASATPFTVSNLGTLLSELDASAIQSIAIDSNAPYKYIRITGNGINHLSLAEVEVYGVETEGPENIALGKPTNASSSHILASPSNATNGNTNGQFLNSAHTEQGANEFWEVNLVNYYNLEEIKVYNRTDCCMDRLNGAKVYASISPFTEYNTGTLLYELDGEAIQTITIDSNAPYKYIRITNNGTNALSLAEVEVYGIETEGPQNVALGKPINVSSSANNTSPSSATDGNTDGNQHNGSVFNTANGPNEFWEVNLENYYNLAEIKVYNRTDCCSDRLNGARVYASASPFTESNLGTFLYELDGSSNAQSIAINGNASYQYIKITNNGTHALILAEVEVYAY